MRFARVLGVVGMLWTGSLAEAAPTAPAAVVLTDAETAEIAKGDVVIRLEATSSGGQTTAIADVKAAPKATMDAVMDLQARVGEISGLKAVSFYDSPGHDKAAKWELSVVGKQIIFHLVYDISDDGTFIIYGLDTSKTNDMKVVSGTYHVYPSGTGTRLVYTGLSDSGVYVPGWLKTWLANGSLVDLIGGVRKRAEK